MYTVDRLKLAALVYGHSAVSPLSRVKGVCALCQKATGASGVALSVAGRGSHPVTSTVCGTDALSMRLEELQLGLAEGPIADALESTFPVQVPDLTDVSHQRWPWFGPAAVQAGALAVFVVPLCAGETPLGALSLYRRSIGDLTAEQFEDFRAIADAATQILTMNHGDSGDDAGSWTVGEGTGFQPEIHQAVGAIMADLGIDADQALARLRGHAYASDRPMSEVAHDIVSGRLHLEADRASAW
jgi:hypothetical protein